MYRRLLSVVVLLTAFGCASDDETSNTMLDGTTSEADTPSGSSNTGTPDEGNEAESESAGGDETSGLLTDCTSAAIVEISLFQVLETRLYADGAAVDDSAVPVVAGRRGLVRARVQGSGNVRVSVNGAPYDGFASNGEGLVDIPAEAITLDATLSVEVAGCPETRIDGLMLNVVETGPVEIRLVPFEVGGFVPDTSTAVVDGFRDAILAVYPATDVVVTVADVVPDAYGGQVDMGELLVDLGVIQEQTSTAPHVYYYGLVSGAETREEFCSHCPTGTSESGNGDRAAFSVGAAFADQRSEDTLIHELGHMHGLLHAPCGDPDLLDEDFPYEDASTTIEGWDFRTETFVETGAQDMMAYCYPRWISDYNYRNLIDWVQLAQTWL